MNSTLKALAIWVGLSLISTEIVAESSGFAETSHQIIEQLSKDQKLEAKSRGLKRKSTDEADANTSTNTSANANPAAVNLAIQFQTNSATLRTESKPLLKELALAANSLALSNQRFIVIGHTDSHGSEDYNLQLSRRRAESVREYLIQNFKLAPTRFTVAAYGEASPLVPNDTPANRAVNRRVEIRLR